MGVLMYLSIETQVMGPIIAGRGGPPSLVSFGSPYTWDGDRS